MSAAAGILTAMGNALEWVSATGATAAAIGTWLGPLRARRELAAARLREGRAIRENRLHRQRSGQVYRLWHDMPDGDDSASMMHWYAQWTGARDPREETADGARPPGIGCHDEDRAYECYLSLLHVRHRDPAAPRSAANGAAPSRRIRHGRLRKRALPGTTGDSSRLMLEPRQQ